MMLDVAILSGIARKLSNPNKVGLPPLRQISAYGNHETPAYRRRTDVIGVRYPSSFIVAMNESRLLIYVEAACSGICLDVRVSLIYRDALGNIPLH